MERPPWRRPTFWSARKGALLLPPRSTGHPPLQLPFLIVTALSIWPPIQAFFSSYSQSLLSSASNIASSECLKLLSSLSPVSTPPPSESTSGFYWVSYARRQKGQGCPKSKGRRPHLHHNRISHWSSRAGRGEGRSHSPDIPAQPCCIPILRRQGGIKRAVFSKASVRLLYSTWSKVAMHSSRGQDPK